ncbi:hypothetical protein ACVIYL_000220 [Bradyrhizobium sp. USDA 3315]
MLLFLDRPPHMSAVGWRKPQIRELVEGLDYVAFDQASPLFIQAQF